MKKTIATTALILAAGFVGVAQAQVTVGAGLTRVSYEEVVEGEMAKTQPTVLRLTGAYELHRNLDAEAILGVSAKSDGLTVGGQDVPGASLKVKSLYGIYLKPKVELGNDFTGYARVGYANAKGQINYQGQSDSGSEKGFSYGVGVSYAIDRVISVSVDYMSFLDKDTFKATGLTLGVSYKF